MTQAVKNQGWRRWSKRLGLGALVLVMGYGLFSRSSFASHLPKTQTNISLTTQTGVLQGTLELPEVAQPVPVVLLIAGSGPTDRDGNQGPMRNNALKLVALGLKEQGIASVRYDKRGIAESQSAGREEKDLRFEHYVQDAEAWIAQLQADPRFNAVFVMGHSEGSLIGMVAAGRKSTTGFVSLAGVGSPAAEILRTQLKAQSASLAAQAEAPLSQLEQGKPVSDYPKALHSLFRPSVQPYLISWFRYHPQQEIAHLQQPLLIVQGDHDLQVTPEDAEKLAQGAPEAQKIILKGMNHVLKSAPLERLANLKTYAQPDVPLHPELLPALVDFVRQHAAPAGTAEAS